MRRFERAVEAAGVEVEVVEAALGEVDAGGEFEELRHLAARRLALDLLPLMTVTAAGAWVIRSSRREAE